MKRKTDGHNQENKMPFQCKYYCAKCNKWWRRLNISSNQLSVCRVCKILWYPREEVRPLITTWFNQIQLLTTNTNTNINKLVFFFFSFCNYSCCTVAANVIVYWICVTENNTCNESKNTILIPNSLQFHSIVLLFVWIP